MQDSSLTAGSSKLSILQGTVNTLVQNRACDAGLIVNTLLSSKMKLPCLSATSLSGESGQSHSGNVFNNKNSDQISFHSSTVEYSFKLNTIAFLQALCWIGSILFSLKLIWLQMDHHSVACTSSFMLRAKQNLRNGVPSRSEPVWTIVCYQSGPTQVDPFNKKFFSSLYWYFMLRRN